MFFERFTPCSVACNKLSDLFPMPRNCVKQFYWFFATVGAVARESRGKKLCRLQQRVAGLSSGGLPANHPCHFVALGGSRQTALPPWLGR